MGGCHHWGELNQRTKGSGPRHIDRVPAGLYRLPGETDVIQYRISLTTTEPIRTKPYAVSHSIRESLKGDISKMLQLKIIRESHSHIRHLSLS